MVLVALAVPAGLARAQATYRITAEPEWVVDTPLDLDHAPPPDEVAGGSYHLLYDIQVNAQRDPVEKYHRSAVRITNEEGLANQSQFTASFDPSYQELLLHSVLVHRNGQAVERLDPARIEVLRRETRFEYQIYDGIYTAVMVLGDLRVGDVVEYRYTIRGRNPVFKKHFSETVNIRTEYLLAALRYRLLWPAGRPLHVRTHGSALEPKKTQTPEGPVYSLAADDILPVHAEAGIPSWFDPYSWVQFTDSDSWGEVDAWALDLFDQGEPALAVAGKAREITEPFHTREDRILALIHFVQDEIRYLAISVGEASHRPSPPAEVLSRLFGDCKEKSAVLVAMLKTIDVDAAPALVNTRLGEGLRGRLPGVGLFDHAIVRIDMGGRYIWVDPSNQYQRGRLRDLNIQRYGAALVLAPGETGLSEVQPGRKTVPLTSIRKSYRVGRPGKPTMMSVHTVMEGPAADTFRGYLRLVGRKNIERDYEDFYSSLFAGTSMTSDLKVEDDEKSNRISMTESYTIPEFWELSDDEAMYTAVLLPQEIEGELPRPKGSHRTMPIGMSPPYHVSYESDLQMYDEWQAEPDTKTVQNPIFRFRKAITSKGRTIHVAYDLETFKDRIDAEQAGDYLKDVDKVTDLLGFQVVTADEVSTMGGGRGIQMLVLVTLITAGSGWLAVRYYRRLPVPQLAPVGLASSTMEAGDGGFPKSPISVIRSRHEKVGIGGWMILPALGIVTAPFFLMYGLVETAQVTARVWNIVAVPGGLAYHPLFGPTLIFEVCTAAIRLIGAVLLMILFFRKRAAFPGFYVFFMLFSIAIIVLDSIFASGLPAEAGAGGMEAPDIFSAVVALVIWGNYFHRSERAKATFVR